MEGDLFSTHRRVPATLRKRFCMVLTCAFIHVVPCNPMCAKLVQQDIGGRMEEGGETDWLQMRDRMCGLSGERFCDF